MTVHLNNDIPKTLENEAPGNCDQSMADVSLEVKMVNVVNEGSDFDSGTLPVLGVRGEVNSEYKELVGQHIEVD